MPERTFLLFMQYFRIGNRGLANRAPVNDFGSFINIPLLIEVDEALQYGMRTALIHGKTDSVPIRGGANLVKLIHDSLLILFLPLPCLFQKAFSSEIMLIYALFLQHVDNLYFRRNCRMIRSGLPECFIALHSLKTNQGILQSII